MYNSRLQKYAAFIIPILFLIYSAPGALDYVFHFPDEKYYTDAVIQMMDKGDYFTPYKADGTPRFLKPIANYWVLIGSYKVFGVSQLSSRLFFWLAGALLTGITFLMARSLLKDQKPATIAAFITASNPLVLMSASRSIPDILLALFLTISAWGFLEIMQRDKPSKKFYWMAYLGAALAFETKGIPAAAFAGISMLFLLFNPWKKVAFKKLIDPVSMTVSIAIALSWFIIMYFEHGAIYLESFFADQVGERVSSKSITILKNGALGIINLIAFLIPWILITISKPKKLKSFLSESSKNNKAIFGFILIWVVLIIIMSGAVFKFYDRYLLPVIPLISLVFAAVFTNSETKFQRSTIKVLLVMNLFVLGINTLYATFILPDIILISGIIFGWAIIAGWFSGVFKRTIGETVIANGIMLLYFNAFVLLYPLLMPNPGEQLVIALREQGISKSDEIYVYGNIRAASNIRIHSNNTFNVVSMDTVFTLPKNPNHFLVFNKKEKDLLNLKNYIIFAGSEEWLRVPEEKFPSFLKQPVLNLKDSGTKYLIAKPIGTTSNH